MATAFSEITWAETRQILQVNGCRIGINQLGYLPTVQEWFQPEDDDRTAAAALASVVSADLEMKLSVLGENPGEATEPVAKEFLSAVLDRVIHYRQKQGSQMVKKLEEYFRGWTNRALAKHKEFVNVFHLRV